MKYYLGILIASLISFNANAVMVCYYGQGGGYDCFGSNGSCDGTWAGCQGQDNGGCDCFAIMPCYTCDNENPEYVAEFQEKNVKIVGKDIDKLINYSLISVEGVSTNFQFDVDRQSKFIIFNVYNEALLIKMSNSEEGINKKDAFIKTVKIAI